MVTLEQSRSINATYLEVDYLNGQIGRYRVLCDTLDQRIYTAQKIADLRLEQYTNEKQKEPIYIARIDELTTTNRWWKVTTGLSILIAISSWIF